jgi:hypothetical protein
MLDVKLAEVLQPDLLAVGREQQAYKIRLLLLFYI